MDENGIEAVIGHQRIVTVLRNRFGRGGSFGGQIASDRHHLVLMHL
jgi:hypothetical protein